MSAAPDRILVVIARTRHKMVQAELQEATKRGARFVELRLDYLSKSVDFARLKPHKSGAWVATLRRPQDGGRWNGTEVERQTMLRQIIVGGLFEYVDIETDIAGSIRRFGPTKRVISYHNLSETPADLDQIYETMQGQDADVIKIAVAAQTPADALRVIELQRKATVPTVAFCIGDFGVPSRFIALRHGAPWMYTAFNRDRGLAPGLPTFDDVRTIYQPRNITTDTKIYGLLGDPVGHSLSPLLHNAMCRKLGIDAIYLPFRVPSGGLPAAVTGYEALPVSGYSVTIPHKEAAAEFAAAGQDATVRLTGAANTLVRQPGGGWTARNTDYTAAVESLRVHLKEIATDGSPLKFDQLFVLILGAGGVARAIAHGLHKEGAHITITARTQERAARLAAEVQCKVVDWAARHNVLPCSVVINCTPVGMFPDVDDCPVHASFLKPGLIVFDTIYNPETTKLIREAKARGGSVITGVDMFVRQAAAQFEAFTGTVPPLDPMRELVRKALSPVAGALEDEAEEPAGDDGAD
ncbi:MAG: shikimate dehydrogenase [Fimbriiglobus sp.]